MSENNYQTQLFTEENRAIVEAVSEGVHLYEFTATALDFFGPAAKVVLYVTARSEGQAKLGLARSAFKCERIPKNEVKVRAVAALAGALNGEPKDGTDRQANSSS